MMSSTSREIKRAALALFASHGYDGTSIRDISAAVGIRGASMYHYFSSKEEILWNLTESALDQLIAAWLLAKQQVESEDPVLQLRAFVRADVLFHTRHRDEATLVNSQLSRLSPEHYEIAKERRRFFEDELATIIQRCVASGEYQVVDERVTRFAILQMIAAIAGWYDPEGSLSEESLASTYEELALKLIAP
ncbi:MAG: TetR/AcrR family transcriptional regulator [Leucobacter sp.]|jgi:AcrR family transcriptional regulator|nr:TetR/AcrR family transcriptional regulator [Leucobacter sp.]